VTQPIDMSSNPDHWRNRRIDELTRDLAAARKELAAANATVEKCKRVADNALDHTENAMDTDEALARCKAGLRNVITAAEAAREGKETT